MCPLLLTPARIHTHTHTHTHTHRPELSKPAVSLYLHNLTGTLETAIRATNAQFEDPDILKRLDVQKLEPSPQDQGWDVFSLQYHVDGPISTVCTVAAIFTLHIDFYCITMYSGTALSYIATHCHHSIALCNTHLLQ